VVSYDQVDGIWVRWETPRRFTVKLCGKSRGYGNHYTVGVVAETVEQAARAAQEKYPDARIESINDTGAVDIVACALAAKGE
jgi:hypothetical protein